MKLLSVNLARSLWLSHISDLNPKGVSLFQILTPFLLNTYKFKKFPGLTEIADLTQGVNFQNGDFNIGNDLPITVNLTIHNDFIIADTWASTAHSDAFLEDLYTKFSEIFKMPPYQSVISERLYLSQVYVTTEKNLGLLNRKLTHISKYLSDKVKPENSIFQVGGISFWPDQTGKSNPSPLTFERTVNAPFSENRYYSSAPLQTDQHLEVLNMLENILS